MGVTAAELVAIVTASLAGSLHCAAMCGGFAVAAAGSTDGARSGAVVGRQVAYALGRLVGYAGLGAVAGALGARLALAGETLAGIQDVAGIVTGLMLVMAGGLALAGRRVFSPPARDANVVAASALTDREPSGLRGALRRLRTRLARGAQRGDAWGAGLLGLASALLPCGWLWAFVALAMAAGGGVAGATVMSAFWLGTVPALAGVAWLTAGLGRKLAPHAPRIVAALMIALGLWSLLGRVAMPEAVEGLGGVPCHSPAVETGP